MPQDIKARIDPKKDIRVHDKSKIVSSRMQQAYVRTKGAATPVQTQDQYASPAEYAADHITRTVDHVTHETVHHVKGKGGKAVQKVKEIRNDIKTVRSFERQAKAVSDPIRQRGTRYRRTASHRIKTRPSSGTSRQVTKSTGKGIKGTTKTTMKSVKTARSAGNSIIKASQQVAKTAQRSAQAAAKTARTALHAVKAAGKAAATAAKAIAKAVTAAVKAIAAGAKAFAAAIAAGGWVVVVIVLVILLVGMVMASAFGIFFSGQVDDDITLQQAIQQLNQEYLARLDEITAEVDHDELQITGARAIWKEIIAVYAVKTTIDPDHSLEVVTMDAERRDRLRETFWDMNKIEYTTESETITEIVYADDGNGNLLESTETSIKTILYITVSGKTSDEIASFYDFTDDYHQILAELLSPEYDSLWRMILFGISDGSDDIVAIAASQIGQVGGEPYWTWYGLSERTEWCAIFVSWCAEQCGYIEAGAIPKFSTTHTQGVSWFQANGQWQDGSYTPGPGDIIFFDWDDNGVTNHVGIVESIVENAVYTIEGNAGDVVRRRSYTLGSNVIYGYGTPS